MTNKQIGEQLKEMKDFMISGFRQSHEENQTLREENQVLRNEIQEVKLEQKAFKKNMNTRIGKLESEVHEIKVEVKAINKRIDNLIVKNTLVE